MPMDHMAPKKLSHLPRSRSGTVSTTTISVKQIMPPPPIPWIERPTKTTVKLSATAGMMEPTRKNPRLT